MTDGEGGPPPGSRYSAGAAVSARLREAMLAAHAEAVDVVGRYGFSINRELVELLALQRRVTRIADELDWGSVDIGASSSATRMNRFRSS
ncbi:hypothetical protein [Nocardia nepalensis]|uniref:hypothetical protein n=1 Tax=Nocardia nepalensis TaxID=3375448 RepID=UPI003B67BDD0